MPIEKQDLRRCLITKFGFEEVAGSKHEAVALFVEGHKVATVRFSRGQRDIGTAILRRIAAEMWVQLSYLNGMYNCQNSQPDYLELLRKTNRL